jgi:hypothetical protein
LSATNVRLFSDITEETLSAITTNMLCGWPAKTGDENGSGVLRRVFRHRVYIDSLF